MEGHSHYKTGLVPAIFLVFLFMGTISHIEVSSEELREEKPSARYKDWQIRDGRLYENGKWVFLKIGKPLRNFAHAPDAKQLIADLPMLQKKGYNSIAIACYWHHFDFDGDGVPDKSLQPLKELIDAIYERGMFPILSTETYGVGGGQIPDGFWIKHPDALAVNAQGKEIRDTEYGFLTHVPSIFSVDYRKAARTFIKNIARGVDTRKLLYFETTVEPQYMGKYNLCYSKHARKEYEKWLKENNIEGPKWPEKFPIPGPFREHEIWNRFRAEFLAKWVNDDAAAFREIAGQDAYIAVDYLETGGPEMLNRNGDSLIFLENLDSANIIQINWHWHKGRRAPNQIAYDNVRNVMRRTKRDWAITEHMTLNGSDYWAAEAPAVLRNTIKQSTLFGWEFVNINPDSRDTFSHYNNDWSPKPLIAVVENDWKQWLQEIRAEKEKR